jgi:hypothetical protein
MMLRKSFVWILSGFLFVILTVYSHVLKEQNYLVMCTRARGEQ